MRKKRKTVAEVRSEEFEAKERAWVNFLPKLRAVSTYEDAMRLHAEPVAQTSPSRSYYSNFGFFLHHFAPPNGANLVELTEYLRILGCFAEQGVTKPEVRAGLEEAIRAAMQQRSTF